MAESSGSKSFVCGQCLAKHSTNVHLITEKCFNPRAHGGDHVLVVWSASKRKLERVLSLSAPPSRRSRIRPLPPKLKHSYHGPLVLCNPSRCRGLKDCTHPHSVEELRAWDAERSPTGELRVLFLELSLGLHILGRGRSRGLHMYRHSMFNSHWWIKCSCSCSCHHVFSYTSPLRHACIHSLAKDGSWVSCAPETPLDLAFRCTNLPIVA